MSNGQMGFSNPLLAIPGGFAAIPRFFQMGLAHIFGNSGCIRVGQLPSFRLLLIIPFLLRIVQHGFGSRGRLTTGPLQIPAHVSAADENQQKKRQPPKRD